MSSALDDVRQGSDPLLLHLQQLTEVIAQQNASLASLQTERDTAFAERDAAQAEIEKLRLLIRQLQRGQFGRRSERLDPDQLQLGLEDLEQTVAAAEAAQEAASRASDTPRPPRIRRRNRGALPAHLPRVEVLVDVEDKSCPCCGGTMHVIGEDTSEMLDIVPERTMGTFPHSAYGPERRCLPFAEWPLRDRAAFEAAQRPAGFLRQGGRAASWAQETRAAVVKGYGRLLTWLTITGQLDPDAEIASRLQPSVVAPFTEHLLELNAVQTVISRLNELHLLARVVDPMGDWAFLRQWQRQLRPQVTDTRNKAARLRHAVDLVDLGFSLIARALAQIGQPRSLAQAILLRDGLMIAFLALRLLRLKNLTALTIGTHLVRATGIWWIQIPAAEMKGKRPFERSFPPVLVPALMDYLEDARLLLLARRPNAQRHDGNGRLWISSGGIPLSAHGVFARIALRTKAAFGRSVYPHLFRDAAATTMAIEDPEHVGITPDLLDHRDFVTNEKHYRLTKSAKSIRTYHDVVEALRQPKQTS